MTEGEGGVRGGGGDGGGGTGGDEEGGDGGDGGDERDVERHGVDLGGLGGEEGVDELPEGAAEGVGEGGDGGGGNAAARGKPEGGVVGWRAEDEGLGEADEDLANHDGGEGGRGGARAGVADPVADQDEEGGGYEGEAGAAGVEGVDCKGGCDDEGEEESGAEPIDDGGGGGEVGGRCVRDGGVGEPLDGFGQSLRLVAEKMSRSITHVPAHDDVHQDQLHETEPSPFVHAVHRRRCLPFFMVSRSSIKIRLLADSCRRRNDIIRRRCVLPNCAPICHFFPSNLGRE